MDLRKVKQETELTSKLFSKASLARIPLSGTFELSPVCNFSCKMCYVRKTMREVQCHSRPMMTAEQWIKIAEEARDQGLLYLLLTGGEPFLWHDFWSLYDRLSEMGFVLSINTNGSLIDRDAIARLKTKAPSRINITLYGASDETYERLCGVKDVFAKVDAAIDGLCEAGIPVKLNCSLTPHNAGDLEEMLRYAQSRDLIISVNTYMFPPLRRDETSVGRCDRFTPQESVRYNLKRYRLQFGEDAYRQFLLNVKKGSIQPPGLDESCVDPLDGKIRCRAGKASFWITWDGLMTPCGMMPEPTVEAVNRPFSEAWQALTEVSQKLQLSGVCVKCPNQSLCHSCAAMALAETGKASGIPSYLCESVAELRRCADEQIAAWNLLKQ